MARLSSIRNSDGLQVVTRSGPDGKERIASFHVTLFRELGDASRVQVRVLAEESRELILDKVYGGAARPPGRARVERPQRKRRPEIPTSERRPYRHAPLAEATVQKKAQAEQDGRRLIATGAYTYGIEVFKGARQGQVYYTVRPKPGNHPTAKLPHRVVAAFHEYGTRTIPKRPHWAPVLRIIKQVLREQSADVRAVALRRAVREKR